MVEAATQPRDFPLCRIEHEESGLSDNCADSEKRQAFDRLGEALLDFQNLADLQLWIDQLV